MTLRSRLINLQRKLFFGWRYLGSPPWDTGISPPELHRFIQSHPPGRALDLGCGTGTNAISLAQAGWEVTGVDFIGSAVANGHEKARRAGVTIDLRQGDVTHLEDVQGPFDLVLDIGCFHSLDPASKIAYTKQLATLLSPQGSFLLYGFLNTGEPDRNGISYRDLEILAQTMECIERVDGNDRKARSSAWFTYRLKR